MRDSLVDASSQEDLVAVLRRSIPRISATRRVAATEVVAEVSRALDVSRSHRVRACQFVPTRTRVGRYMTREWVPSTKEQTIQQVLGELRAAASCRRRPIASSSSMRVTCCAARCAAAGAAAHGRRGAGDRRRRTSGHVDLRAGRHGRRAAKAFERYDLVSAPVVDDRGKLVGRLTVDAVMDFVARRGRPARAASGPV